MNWEILGIATMGILLYMLFFPKRRSRRGKLALTININGIKITSKQMALSLTTTQFVKATLQPQDAKGRPARVEEGSVQWSSSDESVFTVEPDPNDPLSAIITSVGEGTGQLDYSADADLDNDIQTISGFAAVEVIPPQAVGFGIVFGTPEEKPEEPTEPTEPTEPEEPETPTV